MKIKILLTLVLLAGVIVKGCYDDTPVNLTPGSNEVWIQSNGFSPSSISVLVNSTVTWNNKDVAPHTISSTTGAFESGSIGSGGTYSHQFIVAGTYSYSCTLHPNMTGTVIVHY